MTNLKYAEYDIDDFDPSALFLTTVIGSSLEAYDLALELAVKDEAVLVIQKDFMYAGPYKDMTRWRSRQVQPVIPAEAADTYESYKTQIEDPDNSTISYIVDPGDTLYTTYYSGDGFWELAVPKHKTLLITGRILIGAEDHCILLDEDGDRTELPWDE